MMTIVPIHCADLTWTFPWSAARARSDKQWGRNIVEFRGYVVLNTTRESGS